jgi:hypothetical protein
VGSIPFIHNLVSGELKLIGASQHPNEALVRFGSPESTMTTSLDGRFLDHLAEYMIYLSTAPSFWFSINSSYDHEFHLSRRLGIEAMQQEWIVAVAAVLVVAAAVVVVIVVALGSSNISLSSKSTTQLYTICHRRHRTVTIVIVHCHHHRSVSSS